jgi:hypothetical protein
MKWMFFPALIFFAAPAYAGTCMTGGPHNYVTAYDIQECPADIQALMNRMNICAHFAGEEATDAERGAYINSVMDDNACNKIGCDFQTVYANHEGDLVYTGALVEYTNLVYGRNDAVLMCDQPNGAE